MRILAGSVCRQVPEVLAAHLSALKWQSLKGVTVDLAFVCDNDDPASKQLLQDNAKFVLPAGAKPSDAVYGVTSETHQWSVPTFHWLAREKQRLLDLAKAERYDALLLVDSDLLCSPDTLSSLWNTGKDVVSGVFWTKWTKDAPALPQVWLAHPYELQGRGVEAHEFLGALAERDLVRVAGLGACTLIRAGVLDRVAYWPLVEGLPTQGMWQGEDRHFCVRAERNHVELWADAWPDIWHCYRPEQRGFELQEKMYRDDEIYAERRLRHPPSPGDLVSFTIEPLEEQRLAGYVEHVRGRLGAIKVLPDIEKALLTMRAGDESIVRVYFPRWYEVPGYRGQPKLFRVKLLHCKPNASHPTLDEEPGRIADYFMGAA
jgi:hypothetical protein